MWREGLGSNTLLRWDKEDDRNQDPIWPSSRLLSLMYTKEKYTMETTMKALSPEHLRLCLLRHLLSKSNRQKQSLLPRPCQLLFLPSWTYWISSRCQNRYHLLRRICSSRISRTFQLSRRQRRLPRFLVLTP